MAPIRKSRRAVNRINNEAKTKPLQVRLERCPVDCLKRLVISLVRVDPSKYDQFTKLKQSEVPPIENEKVVQPDDESIEDDEHIQQKIAETRQTFMDSIEEEMSDDKENEIDENWEPIKKPTSNSLSGTTVLSYWKPVFGGIRRPLQPIIRRKAEQKEDLSDYEQLRQKNIEEQRNRFLNAIKAMSMTMKPPPNKLMPKKQHVVGRKFVRKVYSTRSSRRNSTSSEVESTSIKEEDSDSDEYTELEPRKRRQAPTMWSFNPNVDILMPEDVTEDMLDNIVDSVSQKVYCQSRGTTCHQCRQKTVDTKTVCRSGHCAGGRGMFCGICLRNRYGQDIRQVLKDPEWWCPPCMDICNCSICRNRLGKGATGPMTWLAQERGFSSVHEYLTHHMTIKRESVDELDE